MMHYIGYATLEGWAKGIDQDNQVYSVLQIEQIPARAGHSTHNHMVVCAQPIDNEVHYCRILVAVTTWYGDQCINEDRKKKEIQAMQAWKLVQEWLRDNKLQYHEASIAVPDHLMQSLTIGDALFLDYSKDKGFFVKGVVG